MNNTHGPPIVIDNGSGICKAGFAEDKEPKVVFPSFVGRPRCRGSMDQEVIYIGNDAQSQRRDLTLTYPIDSGVVTNWDDMEKVWHHTFNELSVAPEEHPVLLTEAPLNPMANREKIMQVMFETFKTPGVYLSLSAVFTLYASGRTTGLVLESGDCISQAVPVIEGGVPKGAIQRVDLAGRDLTFYLMKLISKSGHILTTSYGRDIVREIKEKLCQVALDFDLETSAESNTVAKHTYLLPDGEEIMLGNERFLCPELMFRPSLLSGVFQGEYESLPEIIFNSITKTEYEIQSELYSNIVLGGGNTMFPGFQERLEREVKKLFPSLTQVKTEAEPYRAYSAWLGGSIVASNSSMDSLWIKKEEYDEYGPSVLYKNNPEWW